MLNLPELDQFVTYAGCGTLSATAEILHISQPTLTRTMKHVEESFGAPLFHRGKNRIELTETGRLAVEQSRHLLAEAEKAVQTVRSFEQSLHTIIVHSCAPAPLWSLLPDLSHRFPNNTITSQLSEIPEIISNVRDQTAHIGILPGPISESETYSDSELRCVPYVKENLFVCVPETHALAQYTHLTFSQLNGFNCLLRDNIGFWNRMVKDNMPASRFLIQTDEFEFQELVRNSTLLCFSTNLAGGNNAFTYRRTIPLTDEVAHVAYHLICSPDHRHFLP